MSQRYKRKIFDRRYVPHERRRANILSCIFFWSILVTVVLHNWVLGSVIVRGDSMAPSLSPGQRYLFHRWVYLVRDPRRGEIVVLRDSSDTHQSVKRVIGLPGETVRIAGGRVLVNGREMEEPYLPKGIVSDPESLGRRTLGLSEDFYFVLGDNRPVSYDSRHAGPVNRRNILGRVGF